MEPEMRPDHSADYDAPTVCIAHGRFIPCRKDGEHRYTPNPYWVKSVRDYQESPIPNLSWEPAWERVTPPAEPTFCPCGLVDDRGDGTCGNCGLRIMTEDDEPSVIPPGVQDAPGMYDEPDYGLDI